MKAPEFYNENFEVTTGAIPLLDDYDEHGAWAELFHENKTKWMGWEKHLVYSGTDIGLEEPAVTQMGKVLEKLTEWKSLPY